MSRKSQKNKTIHNSSMFGKVPDLYPKVRLCEWPECDVIGEHRAPRSRDDLNNFRWFCLDHIRLYNKSWNYYEGMSDKQVEADLRDDTSWNRPSWPFAGMEKSLNFKSASPSMDDFGGAFSQSGDPETDNPTQQRHEPDSQAAEAMAVLDLTAPVTTDQIKRRYKELVKRYHPDANGGDKAAEEKFKQISQAYATLTLEQLTS
jgi:curved DNA-binding protein CbpA